MLKIIKGRRIALEQQLVKSIFNGDTQTLKTIHDKLAPKGQLTMIETGASDQAPVEPESPHQSDEEPT